mgnify:CR=1 FL=1
MAEIMIEVPEEIKQRMDEIQQINWSRMIEAYIKERIKILSHKKHMLRQLELEKEYEEQAIEIGNKIKEGVWKKHQEKKW